MLALALDLVVVSSVTNNVVLKVATLYRTNSVEAASKGRVLALYTGVLLLLRHIASIEEGK